jgi:hypothetical protein
MRPAFRRVDIGLASLAVPSQTQTATFQSDQGAQSHTQAVRNG